MVWAAANAVDLNPSGFTNSVATAISGNQEVGYGNGAGTRFAQHALVWNGTANSAVDLNPTGFAASVADFTNGTNQLGHGTPTAGGQSHALLWSGTANSAVDLTPSGFSTTTDAAISGNQEVGYGSGTASGGNDHALLWTGTANGAIDLNPSDFTGSGTTATNGNQQVGSGYGTTTGGQSHALLWSGTAASVIDLQTFLPNTFVASGASSIDAAGDIFGAANGTDGVSHAIEWLPWLLPGDTNRDGIVNAQDIGLIATNWLKTGLGGPGDANDDGIVNGQDIAVIAEHWLQTSGAASPGATVPEPSGWAILALGAGIAFARRKGKASQVGWPNLTLSPTPSSEKQGNHNLI